MKKKSKNASSILEYGILIFIIFGVLALMGGFLQRGLMGKYKETGDAFGFGRQWGYAPPPPPACVYTCAEYDICRSDNIIRCLRKTATPEICTRSEEPNLDRNCVFEVPKICGWCYNYMGSTVCKGPISPTQMTLNCIQVPCNGNTCSARPCPGANNQNVYAWLYGKQCLTCFNGPNMTPKQKAICSDHNLGVRCLNNCGGDGCDVHTTNQICP